MLCVLNRSFYKLSESKQQRGRIRNARILSHELAGYSRTRFTSQDLLSLDVSLFPQIGSFNAHRRFHSCEPTLQDLPRKRFVPMQKNQLMEPLVPQESTREIGSPGNGGDEFSLLCGVCRSVFFILNSASVEVGNPREKIAESCKSDFLLFGRVGIHREDGVEAIFERSAYRRVGRRSSNF